MVLGDDTGTPKAILEQHPSIPNQRALMATLVPKFSLPPSQPEIIFVVDRSGSMSGNIPTLVSAMKVFLKSLPGGVKFNVLSFGSRHSFLWPKSKSYAQESLQQALAYVQGFRADLGGTETFNAMRSAVESRFGDLPLDIMLLTDGQIWNQQQLFDYLNQQVTSKNAGLRVFTLGIGDGISHSLVEGIARAGNGFAQTCTRNEKIETKVIRMLKGCLSPHISDYTLEVKYDTEENGLEMVDKVADGLKVLMMDSESIDRSDQQQKPISLFDLNANPDDDHKVVPGADIDRFEGVPDVQAPKLLQAPHTIPPLFPFTRTSIYLLMSPDTVQATPKSVILRASCLHGPLELEIPVEVLSEPQETIHQLAAKKAIQDLEEGRGWLFDARDQKEGGLLKERFPSRFQDMVEREAVRLGVQFQVGGKWCSFVAVAANEEEFAARKRKAVAKIGMAPQKCSKKRAYTDKASLASRRQKTRLSAGQDMDPDIGDFVETGPTPSTSLLAETKAYSTDSDEEDMGFGVMDMPAGELIRSQMRELSAANSVLAQAPSDGHRSGKFHARYLNISVSSSAPSGGRGGRFDTPSASRGTSSGATYPAATSYYASTRNSGGPLGASSGGRGGSLFGASPVSCGVPHSVPSYDAPSGGNNGALFGSASGVQSRGGGSPPRKQLASMAPRKRMAPSSFKRMSAGYSRSVSAATPAEQSYSSPQPLGGGMQMRASMDEPQPSYAHSQPPAPKPMTDREKVLAIIDLQGFEGSWSAADANADVMKMTALGDLIAKSKSSKPFGECKVSLMANKQPDGIDKGDSPSLTCLQDVFSTAVVVSWLEQRMRAEKDVWELVVDKAKAWIEGEVSGLELEELMKEVRELVARA